MQKGSICEHGPEVLSCPVGQGSFKMDWKSVLWSDESKFDILVGNHGCRVLRAKEEGDLPARYQRSKASISDGMRVHMVWAACMIWKAL